MKRTAKKLIVILMAVMMMAGSILPAFAQTDDGTTANALQFAADGTFKIMHVTDTHMEDDNANATVWLIAAACDREQPDLVVVTGDNVLNFDDASLTKGYIDMLMNVFQTRNIPVAVTFGNHDSEVGAMSREDLMAYYNTYSCSVSLDDGALLSGCGTYNIPVLSSDGSKIKFNVWFFDSGDYDSEGHYGYVKKDQVDWYKAKSDALKNANGGESVNSFAFQHIIVPEVYDALVKSDRKKVFSFEHMYNKGEYYRFDRSGINYGTLNETPCCGYYNDGQFDAMVEQDDVLAMFTGHDHTNAFGVQYKGIDIVNSLSTRYNGDAFSTQYGYRILTVNENDTSVYESKVVHWYDMVGSIKTEDSYGRRLVNDIRFKGFFQKFADIIARSFGALFAGQPVSYAD